MSLNIEMVPVPAGSFQRDEGEENISVITKAYSLGKYPITRQQFLDIMGADRSDETCSSGSMSDPVQRVTWYQAIAFCNKLSLLEGLTPAYTVEGVNDWADLDDSSIPRKINRYISITIDEIANWDAATCNWDANGYRLPTEMEWMWAAMGADKDARADAIDAEGINRTGYTKGYAGSTEGDYFLQKNLGDYAWYIENSDEITHPVGGKLPNELGLYDMSGNVDEWCWDWWVKDEDYQGGTLTDYRGAGSGSDRVYRGGGWDSYDSMCAFSHRFDSRGAMPPYDWASSLGFRVLRPVL